MTEVLAKEERQKRRDGFEAWLMEFDRFLADWMESLPGDVAKRLDYSIDALLPFEAWLLERYPDVAAIRADSEDAVHNAASIYLGETVRKQVGGTWSIELDDPDNVYFRLPIFMVANGKTPICPLALVTTAIDRRKGHFLRDLVTKWRAKPVS